MATVTIPQEVLDATIAATRAPSANEAVVRALEEYNRTHRPVQSDPMQRRGQASLIELMGTSVDFMSAEELQAMRSAGDHFGSDARR